MVTCLLSVAPLHTFPSPPPYLLSMTRCNYKYTELSMRPEIWTYQETEETEERCCARLTCWYCLVVGDSQGLTCLLQHHLSLVPNFQIYNLIITCN